MKAKSSIFVSFAVGAILASLPYTLSIGKANAQAAGPAQQGGFNGQAVPPQGGFGGGGAFGGPGQRFGGANVSSMVTSGSLLFAASGDTIYKIDINSMKVMGEAKLPAPRFQPGNNPGQRRTDQPARAGGNIPPNQKD
jgi:hypothetical protein